MISWAWLQYSEIAVDFALAQFLRTRCAICSTEYRSNLQASRQSSEGSFVFSKVQIASHGNQGKQITP